MSAETSGESVSTAVAPNRSRLWVTLVWVAVAAAAYIAANVVGLLGYLAWHHFAHPTAALSMTGLVQNGSAVAISTAISAPLVTVFFLWAARRNAPDAADYLGIRWPLPRQWGIAALAFVLLFLLEGGVEQLFPDAMAANFMTGTFHSAKSEGTLIVLALAVAVLGPISEEVAFRGFFYARLAPRLGVPAAIVLTAMTWSALHVQYGWSSIAEILVMGVVLGTLRWRSGSTSLTIVFHALWNAAGLLQVALGFGAN